MNWYHNWSVLFYGHHSSMVHVSKSFLLGCPNIRLKILEKLADSRRGRSRDSRIPDSFGRLFRSLGFGKHKISCEHQDRNGWSGNKCQHCKKLGITNFTNAKCSCRMIPLVFQFPINSASQGSTDRSSGISSIFPIFSD